MLSASHNPMPDNGIKFFARGGVKLADALEDAIEARMREPWQRPIGARVGRITGYAEGGQVYVEHLLSTLPSRLDGLTVVVDAAHGAAYQVSPAALRAAGAVVIEVGCEPTGLNINDGIGSTHLDVLRAAVLAHSADAGIAHDGDADRCLAVDHTGRDVDGDQILAILATEMHRTGRLAQDTVVATVMSNLGFKRALDDAGLKVVETAVGDRYVLEAMNEGGFTLGGEQSGHVILAEHASTGDGTLTALHLLARVAASGKSLAELATVMTRYPQVLINVSGVDRSRLSDAVAVHDAVGAAEARLGATGRVLLRPSGTEPLIRVMVEAESQDVAQAVADELAGVVRAELG
jgi:phosphoglucosamine mutase